MRIMPAFGILGAGRMGGALVQGWAAQPKIITGEICIIDPHPGPQAQAVIEAGAFHLPPGENLYSLSTLVVAVKPQLFAKVGPELASFLNSDCLIVSIMAGTTLSSLSAVFPGHPIVRAMPNTPAAIGRGITAMTGGPDVSEAHLSRAHMLLQSGGPVLRVNNEDQIDAVTAISGSGPAYIFHMVEALEAAARSVGLPDDQAAILARATITGAGALLDSTEDSPEDLRVAVTSPNGTTAAALSVLMADPGLSSLMQSAVKAAYERAKELGKLQT